MNDNDSHGHRRVAVVTGAASGIGLGHRDIVGPTR